jgi:hypothetical protein
MRKKRGRKRVRYIERGEGIKGGTGEENTWKEQVEYY